MRNLLSLARTVAMALSRERPRRWEPESQAGVPDYQANGNYLVSITGGIGDALIALPMIRILKEHKPQSRIVILANTLNKTMLQFEPEVGEFITWVHPPSISNLILLALQIRSRHFIAVIGAIPSNLVSTGVVLKMSGIPQRIKHWHDHDEVAKDWQFWFTDLVKFGQDKHRILANLDLLHPLGIDVSKYEVVDVELRARVSVKQDEMQKISLQFIKHPDKRTRIGLHPGCKEGWEFKRWNFSKFAKLADKLIMTHEAEILWFGGPDERTLIQHIMGRMTHHSCSLAGKVTLGETAAIISTCALFISNDSGLMHIATSMAVPTIALFSSENPRNNPVTTGPIGKGHIILKKPNLQDITVDEVTAAVESLVLPQDRNVLNGAE